MAKEWFVRQDGKTFGPFDSSKLKAMASDGRIKKTAEVANESKGPWHAIEKLKGIEFSPKVEPEIPLAPSKPATISAPATATANANHETTIWTGSPSQLVNLKLYLLCIFVIPIPWAIWRFLVTKTTRYEVTNQRFKISWGVISKNTHELELYRVKDTTFTQSVFQRLFGLASIAMSSSDTSTPFVSIMSIPAKDAKPLRESIRAAVEAARDRKRVREVDYA